MPEENKIPAAEEGEKENPELGENSEADADQKTATTDTGNEDAGKGEGEGGEGDKDTSKGEKEPKPTKEDSQVGKDDNQEPPTRPRLSTQDFIIGRQKARLAKKQEKTGDETEEADDDDEVLAEDEALITKVVAKRFAPILDRSIAAEDEKEISEFLKENPDFAPFEAKAKRYIAHPSRRHLPVATIFYEVAGKDLLKIGAGRQKKADDEAKDTQTGGGSNRAGEGKKNDWELSPEEFEAKQERIRQGKT